MTMSKINTDCLTRSQAVAIVGEAAVDRVDAENCELTNRNGGDRWDLLEWAAVISTTDQNGISVHLYAMYYTTEAEVEAAGDDLSNIDWEIDHYRVR